jgi:polysaccharide chain length determinant protein (PEP-CTERM system associated)
MEPREESPDQSEKLKQSIYVLKTHSRSVFLASLLTAIAGIMVISLIPDKYEASTTILVDPQKIPERYVASTITSDPNAHLNTLTQQVLSASRLQEIVDHLNPYPDLQKKMSREELLDFIRSKIEIEVKPGSEQTLSSFSISYIDRNRWLVAPIANKLAASFIEWNLRSRQQQAVVTTQFLSNELKQAQQGLEEQESALEQFRMQHAGATPDQLDANLQALSRLQAAVQSHMDAISRLDEERLLISQQPIADNHDPSVLGVRGRLLQERNRLENELRTLRRQYTDSYPDVVNIKAQLDSVNAQLSQTASDPASPDNSDSATGLRLNLINKDIEKHKEQIAALQDEIAGYQHKVQAVPVLETQLAELTRNYETSRQSYQSLLDKRLSAGMSEDLERRQQSERFTVLDPARTPDKPFQPKRLPFMAGVVVSALVLPTALIIALHLYDGTIRSEADLTNMIPSRYKVLTTVPPIVTESDVRRSRVLSVQTALISLLACAVLIVFLMKVRPVL